jgi:RNA polymerase sigma-70 factor, ECF subfamily
VTIPSDFSLRLPLPATGELASPATPSRLEDEVVDLFDELRDRLLRYLLCLGVSMHDGEEIVQESFLLLFQHLQRGKSRENLRGWLFRVARNLALKLYRDESDVRSSLPFNDDRVVMLTHDDANPERQAYNRQRQKQLWAVVSALPEQDQICLFLRADGMRYREIGQTMGISLGSVAASLARSLGKLARVDGGSI